MRNVSQADAVRGRWAANPLGWLITLVPSMLVVAVQEVSTPFPNPWFVVASGFAQHLVGGGAAVLLLATLRLVTKRPPVATIFLVWGINGALRGIVGGAFAGIFAHAAPEYGYRIAFWILAGFVWMPVFTYLFAQIDLRRALLGELDSAATELAIERHQSTLSTEQLRGELVATVRDAVAPLVADVRERLAAAAEADATIPLEPITRRLESIAEDARAMVTRPTEHDPVGPVRQHPWFEVLAFDRTRPIYLSVMTLLGVASLAAADASRVDGLEEALEITIAVFVGAAFMCGALALVGKARRFRAPQAIAVFAVSSMVAFTVRIVIERQNPSQHEVALAIAMPILFACAASALSVSVGLQLANFGLLPEVQRAREELATLRVRSAERNDAIRAQVRQLLHGPILGRLSACVMALNFYLAEPHHKRDLRRAATTEGVLTHLELISADFEQLAKAEA